jgi:1-acyl-sn-glycerol-3-phosphate acyltransferase
MSTPNQFSLFRQRRFAPFFWTQFLGAFNDNIFKTALLTIITYDALSWTDMDQGMITNLIPALFILPFFLFSASAGQLSDKFDKGTVARWVKIMEIAIMAVAAYGWMTQHLWLLIGAIVGMGLHSAIFGPVKFSYMPQHLKTEELMGGNGVVEMGTFVGILLGEVIGAVLVVQSVWGRELVAFSTMGIAVIGWLCSLRIPASPAPDPSLVINWNPLTEIPRNLRFSRQNRVVFLAMLGNSWFWFYGAIMLAQFPLFTKNYLHGDHSVFVLLLIAFSLGIGVGSLLCERLSDHKVEIGLVPFGAIGLTIFGVDLFFASNAYSHAQFVDVMGFLAQHSSVRILLDCMLIGVFGGFYIVPLFALIQTRSDRSHLSRTIAGMNILNALFMVLSAVVAMILLHNGFTIPQIFLTTALLNLVVALYIFSLVPEFLLRFLSWLLINTVYRVKRIGIEKIPACGPALLACNHVSYVDALVILAASPRPIRFVMDHRIFNTPILIWLFKIAKVIPIATAKEDASLKAQAYADIAQALEAGDLVCIFPEGRLTSDGEINAFRAGIKKMAEQSQMPVIPMALRGLWGSVFTRDKTSLMARGIRQGVFSKLELVIGDAVPPELATPEYLQEQVQALRGHQQ